MRQTTKRGSSSPLLDAKKSAPSAANLTSPAERPIHLRFVFFSLALVLASCATRDTQHHIVISAFEQRLAVLDRGNLMAIYPVSTSKFGLGDWPGSYRTPLGELEVAEKVGDRAAPGTVF